MTGAPEQAGPEQGGPEQGGSSDLGRVLVVVPTYQEREALPTALRRLAAAVPEADVLVVDDASPDGTGAVADAAAARDPRVSVLHRPRKEGLGPAYVAGFRRGLDAGYDVLVQMDADGSHAPEELPRLLAALRSADVVLGSRWVPGGSVQRWPASRMLLSRGGNAYVRAVLGLPLADATGGFRAFRAPVLERLDLASVASHGYCFQVDVAWRAWSAGARVVEVPITFVEREVGASKMSREIVAEALLRVTAWGVSARAGSLGRSRAARGLRRVGAERAGEDLTVPLLLLVAFVVVPLIEIAVLIQVGQVVGTAPALLLLLVVSVVGAWLARREGTRAWRALREALAAGRMPGREVADGALVLIGATLLLTPGFVTDAVGGLLLLPPSRAVLRRVLLSWAVKRSVAGRFGSAAGSAAAGGAWRGTGRSPAGGRPGRGPVVEGEVVDGPGHDETPPGSAGRPRP